MASRALFNTQFTSSFKRAGVRYSSSSAENDFIAQRNAVKHHAADAAGTWKKITFFVAIPALITSSINAYKLYEEHHEHQKHHPKEWVRYPYLNLRAKDFFWGKESLFFNPETNLSASEE